MIPIAQFPWLTDSILSPRALVRHDSGVGHPAQPSCASYATPIRATAVTSGRARGSRSPDSGNVREQSPNAVLAPPPRTPENVLLRDQVGRVTPGPEVAPSSTEDLAAIEMDPVPPTFGRIVGYSTLPTMSASAKVRPQVRWRLSGTSASGRKEVRRVIQCENQGETEGDSSPEFAQPITPVHCQSRSIRRDTGILQDHDSRGERRSDPRVPAKEMVDRGRIELPTPGFSVPCSTN